MSVEVRNLARRFTDDGPPAVADVSFTAPTGAITAVLGPSGAGKSTVLRIIAGLEEPDAGRVLLSGEDVTATPVQKRGVGFVFQGYALFGHLTVRENVAFGLRVRRVPRREAFARADALLARVACHGAVRFGDPLQRAEMTGLLADLDTIPFAATCPHGRPLLIELTRAELQRRVLR
ncbi:MAG TPA: ATP-binding cassette domain-containing protein [Thermoanaerobaculia bacterium]|nr:ATP-binding cassette domain-containing protein [Thermoanaerobaculia bacterium]